MSYSTLNVDTVFFADNFSENGSNGITMMGSTLTGTKFTGQQTDKITN